MSAGDPHVVKVKLLLCGNPAVGKSCLSTRFVDNVFDEASTVTVAAETFRFVYAPTDLPMNAVDPDTNRVFERTSVQLNIWDCPGQVNLLTATPSALRNADAAFLCFDVTSRTSFDAVPQWAQLVQRYSPDCICIIIGTKADLNRERTVLPADADEAARRLRMPFFETSAKDASNVTQTFLFIAENLRRRWYANRPREDRARKDDPPPRVVLSPNSDPVARSSKGCPC